MYRIIGITNSVSKLTRPQKVALPINSNLLQLSIRIDTIFPGFGKVSWVKFKTLAIPVNVLFEKKNEILKIVQNIPILFIGFYKLNKNTVYSIRIIFK